MDTKKVVILVSVSPCEKEAWGILETILEDRIDLFCALGHDCRMWEDVMDETIVEPGATKPINQIVTTSHPGESIEEVRQYAIGFYPKNRVEIKIVKV